MTRTQSGPVPSAKVPRPEHQQEAILRLSQFSTPLHIASPAESPGIAPHEGLKAAGIDYPSILTPKHLCELLHLSLNTVFKECAPGGSLAPVAYKVGHQWRVSKPALMALLEGRAQ